MSGPKRGGRSYRLLKEKQVEPIVTGLYEKEKGDELSLGVRFESEPYLVSGLDCAGWLL